MLAGLINDQDRSTASKVPGLGQVPVAGRLFSSNNGNATKSEIVLSITPHIIRPQTLPEARNGDVWSGTESIVREKPLRLDPIGAARSGSGVEMPALAPSNRQDQAAAQPESAPKAGGAGGSRILSGDRPGIDSAPAPAAAASAAAGSAPGRAGTSTTFGSVSAAGAATPAYGTGNGTSPGSSPVPTTPLNRGVAPPTVRPGRAMAPAGPSSPAGTAPPAPPPPAADGG